MAQVLVVLNAGSSSLKFALYQVQAGVLAIEARGQISNVWGRAEFAARNATGQLLAEQRWETDPPLGQAGALQHLLRFIRADLGHDRLIAVGHRVTHGARLYADPVRIDARVLDTLATLNPLAPLHQVHNLAPARQLLAAEPELLQVACFDTAFHRSNPEVAQRLAIPAALHASGIQHYGFHGLSYEYIASILPTVDARAAAGRTVVMHLGSGASLCALAGCQSLASSMGFTPLDGIPMGTRPGALDPGVLLYLISERGMDGHALQELLYQQCGLLGVSGISSDVRTLLASADPRARLALDVQLYGIRRELGALAAVLGGLDAVVFTAGIGENSAATRARICTDAAWLGIELDPAANALPSRPSAGRGDGASPAALRISHPSSPVSAWVIPTDEELVIARHTQQLLVDAAVAAPVR